MKSRKVDPVLEVGEDEEVVVVLTIVDQVVVVVASDQMEQAEAVSMIVDHELLMIEVAISEEAIDLALQARAAQGEVVVQEGLAVRVVVVVSEPEEDNALTVQEVHMEEAELDADSKL